MKDASLEAHQREEKIKSLRADGASFDELSLTMTHVAANANPAVSIGAHNARAYAEASARWIVRDGIRRQMAAFRGGFGAVFPARRLRAFCAAELRLLVCGERGPAWTRDHLLHSLPPGGLANLHPRLTVVRKVDAGDGSYPSVNTCVHYLKLPEYSCKEVLRLRLLNATNERGFHLN
ncbi:putative hect E3 ubiquitin ligase [Operophtera brumata]|uniref:E3 ubiquitin-protein ligase n=1 Tax=Operophtera brumata TaxID=104452 RepID=A0A0L7LUS3_OPEBR|nr:putative hect E3 ubiquitin ligase [Operophtera brumata]